MSRETTKARARRDRSPQYDFLKTGRGIDIGCGDDPVNDRCLRWDVGMGDAQILDGVPPDYFDWVYSSHCLEHLPDPAAALGRWWETVAPGGFLLVAVPDEDLYEQGEWPSRYNPDHRHTFTESKERSWSPVSVNLRALAASLPGADWYTVTLCDGGYDYGGGAWDRTRGNAEAHLELLARKQSL